MNLTVPNLLSLVRMGIIPLFFLAVLDGRPGRALALFALAGLTDLLDGFIARFLHQESPLGSYLDPIADKLLLVTAFVTLTIPGNHAGYTIPLWVTVLVIARDVLILTISLLLYLAEGITRFPPAMVSKLTTAAQIAAVILVLATGLDPRWEGPAVVSVYTVAGLTVASGLIYIYRSNRMIERAKAPGR